MQKIEIRRRSWSWGGLGLRVWGWLMKAERWMTTMRSSAENQNARPRSNFERVWLAVLWELMRVLCIVMILCKSASIFSTRTEPTDEVPDSEALPASSSMMVRYILAGFEWPQLVGGIRRIAGRVFQERNREELLFGALANLSNCFGAHQRNKINPMKPVGAGICHSRLEHGIDNTVAILSS